MAWRTNNIPVPLKGGGFRRFVGLRGVADVIGILPQKHAGELFGNILCVECKMPKGKLSEHQEIFLENIRKKGGIAIVAHDVQELHDQIEEYMI